MAAALKKPDLIKAYCVPIMSGTVYLPISRMGYVSKDHEVFKSQTLETVALYHDLSEQKYKDFKVGQIASIYKGEDDITHIFITGVTYDLTVTYEIDTHKLGSKSEIVTEKWDQQLLKEKRIFLGCWMV